MSYVIPVFNPVPGQGFGYEWDGVMFARIAPKHTGDLDDMDPVELREQGIIEDDGAWYGSRFTAEESAVALELVRQTADAYTVAMVVSLN